jgi:GTP-binding protein YchF
MEIAIVGLKGSGKTTLFNALTGSHGEAGPAGATAGRLQVGVTKVQDARLETLARIFGPQKVTPAEVIYWDIPAATAGDGHQAAIGGPFLNQLQGALALIHVVRAFDDPRVPHAQGSVDPLRDVAAMRSELVLSDMVILERRSQRIETGMKGSRVHERDVLLREQALVQKVRESLEKEVPLHQQSFFAEEARLLANYQLLSVKPLLVVYNIGEENLADQPKTEAMLSRVRELHGVKAIGLCVKLEAELARLDTKEEQEFRDSLGLKESGVRLLVQQSLALLGMVSFFTFVSQEVRAWTVASGTPAVRAAGRIHSDMERGFIRAEVVSFDDLVASGSLATARKGGLLRSEGKTYRVQDGDVITFLFNV